jgi:hypothetical protein
MTGVNSSLITRQRCCVLVLLSLLFTCFSLPAISGSKFESVSQQQHSYYGAERSVPSAGKIVIANYRRGSVDAETRCYSTQISCALPVSAGSLLLLRRGRDFSVTAFLFRPLSQRPPPAILLS